MSAQSWDEIDFFICPCCGHKKLRPKWQREQKMKEYAKRKADETIDAVLARDEQP